MRRLDQREGYLLIDHTASPGVSKADLDKLGMVGPAVGEGQKLELKTFTCSHCQGVVIMNPERTRERASCHKCYARICDKCAATGECSPFEKKVETTFNHLIHGN
jgi:hypothetical protein